MSKIYPLEVFKKSIFIFLLIVSNGLAHTQSPSLSIQLKDKSLQTFLDKVESITDYHFLFKNSKLDTQKSISADFKDKSLKYILDSTLASNGIDYEIIDKRIILIPKTEIPVKFASDGQQIITIEGTIFDAQQSPLPGASVILKGTSSGVQTDFDGHFSIEIPALGGILVVSYIGFKTQEVVIEKESLLQIVLEEDVSTLDDIVVVGYGTQTKKEVTGAVSIITAESITEMNPTRIEQALQGQVAGVDITSTSGAPGSGLNIRIRGVSTNGDNKPLILVDGNVIEELNVLNPNDIKSINILKDATAAIYGARGANGVIIITTKTGVENAPLSINYDNSIGIQEALRRIPVLNALEYAAITNEAHIANNEPKPFPDLSNLPKDTNWQDAVLETAPMFKQNLNLSGGIKKYIYSFSGSQLTQDGIVGGNKANFRRYTARLGLSTTIFDKLKVNTITTYMNVRTKQLPADGLGSILFNALNIPSTLPVYDSNGDYTRPIDGLGNEIVNPIQQIDNTFNQTKIQKVSGSYAVSYDFLDGFSAEVRYQFNRSKVLSDDFFPVVDYGSGKTSNRVEGDDRYTISDKIYNDYTWDGLLHYNRTWQNKHSLRVVLGYESFRTRLIKDTNSTGIDLPKETTYNTANLNNAKTLVTIDNNLFDSRLLSYFSRVQYDYKKRYLLSMVLRRDGSSIFGPENRVGYFPSVSMGWVISDEDFYNIKVINFVKLRASYGIIGNDRIAESGGSYRTDINFVNAGRYAFGQNPVQQGVGMGVLPNPAIKWEQQTTTNIGLDAQLFDGDIKLSLDYFYRRTDDLLARPQVSGLLGDSGPGSGPPVVNAGAIENKGLEFSIGYRNQFNKDWSIGANYNFTILSNKVISINDDKGFLQGGSFGVGQDPPSRMEAGFPIGYFYGYKTDGVFQNQAEVDALATNNPDGSISPYQQYAQPGELRYVDINGDGKITPNDRTNIGNPIPEMIMGLNLSLNYKNIDLQAYVNATLGNEIIRNYERTQPKVNKGKNILNRWRGAGSTNIMPYVTTGSTLTTIFSDYYVEDGSYLKIQNVQIGYTFPDRWMKKIRVKRLRLYGSVNNAFIFTKYRGYDPSFSSGDPIGGGIDSGFYPAARIYLFGLNLTI